MTNAKTNSCLPAAPSARGKSSILHSAYCTMRHSAFCILRSALCIAALAAMTASAATIYTISSPEGSASYTTVGATIKINVFLEEAVHSVSGSPYLVLSGIQNVAGQARADYKRLITPQGSETGMQFEYVVRAGDFSAGVGIQSFVLNNATVSWGADPDTD